VGGIPRATAASYPTIQSLFTSGLALIVGAPKALTESRVGELGFP